ncbi:peroxiredoxin-like family protein [uncultured Alsobacter sp.]|uniref:peroxiredoxin-like family protein n=1 Tax=uncultured Alsobacter sp. TaxID=1748258 RepID=UPI0025D8D1A5|nr:peroxiredoxin-like family protein [uncultured Alsobacter sp.]
MTTMAAHYTSLGEAFRAAVEGEGPVNERLAIFADTLRRLDPAFTAMVDRYIARLEAVGAGQSAPGVGEPMPEFVLPDEEGHLTPLGAFLDKGPAVIALHRGHWCPYCRINARALAQAHRALADLGGSVVAITPERAAFAARFRQSADAHYPVLVDIDNGYALALNLAIWLDADMRRGMESFNVDLAGYQGNDHWMLPIPATFVVGTDGIVKARFIDPDYRRRMDIDDLLAAVAAIGPA